MSDTKTSGPLMVLSDTCDIRPVGDKIIVQPESREETTNSGIVMPTRDTSKPQVALILAVGEGRLSKSGVMLPMPVKVGQRVIYERYSGTEIKAGEKPAILILEVDDIIGVLE